jgi:hypothetical protein
MRTLKNRIKEDMKNPEFKKAFEEEDIFATLAIQIANERQGQGMGAS